MGTTLDYQIFGNYGLLVHSDLPVSDVDWRTYIATRNAWYSRLPPDVIGRTMVLTDGVGPSPRQRNMLKEDTGPKKMPTAILSLSPATRGIVTAMSWFGFVNGKAFKPVEYELAFDWLQVPVGSTRFEILRRLLDMRRQYIGDITAMPIDALLGMSIQELRNRG